MFLDTTGLGAPAQFDSTFQPVQDLALSKARPSTMHHSKEVMQKT